MERDLALFLSVKTKSGAPTQSPIQWLLEAVFSGNEAVHSSPSSATVKNSEVIPTLPCLYGVVLSAEIPSHSQMWSRSATKLRQESHPYSHGKVARLWWMTDISEDV